MTSLQDYLVSHCTCSYKIVESRRGTKGGLILSNQLFLSIFKDADKKGGGGGDEEGAESRPSASFMVKTGYVAYDGEEPLMGIFLVTKSRS